MKSSSEPATWLNCRLEGKACSRSSFYPLHLIRIPGTPARSTAEVLHCHLQERPHPSTTSGVRAYLPLRLLFIKRNHSVKSPGHH